MGARRYVIPVAAALLGEWSVGQAANPEFQSFFFDACVNPTGLLAARCDETAGGLGNLSGDSESSLNPSQSLSSNDSPLARARTRSKQARERGDRLREEEDQETEGSAVSIGPFSMLVHMRGSSFDSDRVVDVDAERGLDGDSWGAEVGFDYRVSDRAFVGLILGLEQSDSDFVAENPGNNFVPAANAGDASDDSTSITLFGSVNLTDNFYFEGSAGYVSSDFEFHRNSVFQESGRVIPQTDVRTLGETNGDVTWASINFGLNLQRNAMSFGPYFGATYSSSMIDAYAEQDLNNSGLGMAYGDIERNSLLAFAGMRFSWAKSLENGVVLPQIRFEYEHESDRDPTRVSTSFLLDAAQTQYDLVGDKPDRDDVAVGFGVAWVLPNGWQPFIDIETLTGNSQLDRYRLAAGFRVEF